MVCGLCDGEVVKFVDVLVLEVWSNLNLLLFMCWFVKEGNYVSVEFFLMLW